MAGSLKEALELAMGAKTGSSLQLPIAPSPQPAAESATSQPADFAAAMQGVTPLQQEGRVEASLKKAKSTEPTRAREATTENKDKRTPPRKARGPSVSQLYKAAVRASLSKSAGSTPRYPHLREPTVVAGSVNPSIQVVVGQRAQMWQPDGNTRLALLREDDSLGARQQLANSSAGSPRDVVIGLDFGTSASKLVITDRTLQESFAVPFRNATGAPAYILPSVLHEGEGGYSLLRSSRTTTSHPGLKLSLFRDPFNLDNQARIAAYIGLVIRSARAWLFANRDEEYRSREIIWTLAIGQPADHGVHAEFQTVYRTLAVAGWTLSCLEGEIPVAAALEAVERARRTGVKGCDAEVVPMPEIAAQVYGFITSSHFDPSSPNIFLLADVGAGTLDACLFRVSPGRVRSQWSLEVFTSDVREHGVMNLHDYRIHWWQRELGHVSGGAKLANGLSDIRVPIDEGGRIPPRFRDYFEDVEAIFSGGARDPDATFYYAHVLKQVRGSTLYHAFSSGVLEQRELGRVPFFLCGGGSRMAFYQQLNESLLKTDGFTWLSAMGRELTLPKELVADGLARSDFDRLSVAYGLSQLTLASAARAQPRPRASSTSSPAIPQWRTAFIDKDQV